MLTTQGKRDYDASSFKSRTCVLKGNCLYYLKDDTSEVPAGTVLLDGANIALSDRSNDQFEIITPSRTFYFKVPRISATSVGHLRRRTLSGTLSLTVALRRCYIPPFAQASSPDDCQSWIAALRLGVATTFEQNKDVQDQLMSSLLFPQKRGWLTKQGAFVKTWKRRYVIPRR